MTGAVFGDGRERCSFGQYAHGARAHEGSARGSGHERSDDAASAAPFSVPSRLLIGPDQSTGVRLQRAANTLGTLRRALEHSADYAGRSPDSAVCGAAHNFSALCLGARPKPPSRGMGGSSAPRATLFHQHHSAISSRASSCASASKAASSASALEGSDSSSAVSGAIVRTDRGFPGCVAVWISLSLLIDTWV